MNAPGRVSNRASFAILGFALAVVLLASTAPSPLYGVYQQQWHLTSDCGARYETLHADGQVHVDVQPPIGEPEFDGQDDPDHNPVCNCPRAPRSWCDRCAGVL